jgi:hypothetical protein
VTKKLVVKKFNGSLHPATQQDHEVFDTMKINQPYQVEIKQWSQRSLKHHQLYWTGLVGLVSQYWQAESGLIAPYEKKLLKGIANFIKRSGNDSTAIESVFKVYLSSLKAHRAENITLQEPDKEAIHEWLKDEAGYFDWIKTPGGLKKRLRSINFNAMSQEDFSIFYKRTHKVAWNYLSNKNLFQSEEEMDNAINQLLAMCN